MGEYFHDQLGRGASGILLLAGHQVAVPDGVAAKGRSDHEGRSGNLAGLVLDAEKLDFLPDRLFHIILFGKGNRLELLYDDLLGDHLVSARDAHEVDTTGLATELEEYSVGTVQRYGCHHPAL